MTGVVAALTLLSVTAASLPAAGADGQAEPENASCLLEGCEEWVARYSGPGNDVDAATSVRISPDGSRVFVTGLSYAGSTSFDFATAAYEASTGNTVWVSTYDGPAHGFDSARAIDVSPDGATVFITGVSMGSDTSRDFATIAYDADTGEQRWEARYDHIALVDFPHALSTSPDGSRVFVTGESSGGSASAFDFATVAYDSATGAQSWVSRYNGPAFSSDKAYALSVLPDGSALAVTGQSFDPDNSYDFATVAYNAATGTQLWAKLYDGTGNQYDVASAIHATPDNGRFITAGSSTGSGTGWDATAIAYDSGTGAVDWISRYNGPQSGTDQVNDLAITPDGSRVVMVGTTQSSSGSTDMLVLARDAATGAPSWVQTINGAANGGDIASAVTLSPDGSRAYVAGDSQTGQPNGLDVAALGLDVANGGVLWSAMHNGPSSKADYATSLALSPEGTWLYVAGSTWNGSAEDYVTLAFRAVSADVPSAPQNLEARPGDADGEIVLTWDPPQDAGGAPVERYRVYRVGPDGTSVTEVSGQTYIDGGRLPLVPYRYHVTAVNAVGEGEASATACSTAHPSVGADPVLCGLGV